jgi:hypothetical protein
MHDELDRVGREAVVVYLKLHYGVWFWRLRKITVNLRLASVRPDTLNCVPRLQVVRFS